MTIKAQVDETHVAQADLERIDALAEVPAQSSWRPTRKWIANLATGVAAIVGSWIVTGAFDDVERGLAAALLAQLATTYFVPNSPTPGGVPDA